VAVCDPAGVDATPIPDPAPGTPPDRARARELYRRRQRRRAIIAWSVAGLLVVAVGLVVAFGGESEEEQVTVTSIPGLFVSEMTSSQYEQIQKGQDESTVLGEIGVPGSQEDEVEDPEILQLFPPEPAGSSCSFWKLSDAPEHLVRLCFSEPERVLLQKTVAALGEDAAPRTLV
jgi:hypothetical protein